MIIAVTQENSHYYGDVMPGMYRLRYRSFIQRQNYDVFSIRRMEYDMYDTPAAVYLVWRDSAQMVRGCTRMSPIDRPYMIKDIWPELIEDYDSIDISTTWEGSRFCIDKDLPPELRRSIHNELIVAMHEYALSLNLKSIIGVMQPGIWRHVFVNSGWPVYYLGKEKRLEKERIVAGHLPVSEEILGCLRATFNFSAPVICNADETTLLREVA